MEKSKFNSRAVIPLATAIIALVFIGVGLKDFGFWDNQPTAAFFPIIIAVVLLLTSILCPVSYTHLNPAVRIKTAWVWGFISSRRFWNSIRKKIGRAHV